MDSNIDLAIKWFANSGIQNLGNETDMTGQNMHGSFNAWFDLETLKYSYVYSEISGYGLSTLLYLYHVEKNQDYLEKAKLVGDWLVSVQDETGAFDTAFYMEGQTKQKSDAFHTFDCGMVFNGLANLYSVTKEEKYLLSARKAADWVINTQKPDDSIPAKISKMDASVMDTEETWSTLSGAYHAKLAIGLLNIFDLTKIEMYKDSAIALCDFALTKQNENGQFLTYGKVEGTNLHPHIYASEGLYVAGKYLDNQNYLDSSKRSVEWVLSLYKDGLIPRHKHGDDLNYNARIDIVAQALRMASLFGLSSEKRNGLKDSIVKYQYVGDNQNQQGGISFGVQSDGSLARHLNSWVTMFAIQALIINDELEIKPSVFYLI